MIIKGGVGAQTLTGTSSADTIYGGDASDLSATNGAIGVSLVRAGLDAPLFVTNAPGDASGLYIVQKGGQILRYDLNAGTTTTFLDLSAADFNQSGERGLLGLAFDPDYATNDKFYVSVTRADGDVQVREYTHAGAATATTATNTRNDVITIEHSAADNHNGGWIGFHPTNGLLYIAVGDGGGAGDPEGDAQNVNSPLGKMLRIDVGSDQFPTDANRDYAIPAGNPYAGTTTGLDEIFASGLRNPWRNSFDAAGNLWIADVGQSEREEINFIAANSNGGQNFGWNVREGTLPYAGGSFGPGTVTNPIFQYSHAVGNSITGGYVYHGPGAGLQSAYVFGDFGSGRIFALENDGAVTSVDLGNALSQDINSLASFGEDTSGNLYAVDYGGNIYRIIPSAGAGDGNDVINAGAGNDKVYGGLGNDTLNGETGIDSLIGGVGNDILNGGAGGDYMNGGAGDDAYIVDFASDKVVEAASSGLDRVNSSISYTLADNVEALTLTGGGAITATGNNGANYLGGNAASNGLNGRDGDDTLSGNGGNDLLSGGRGIDALMGGAGSDAFLFNTTPGVGNVDTISDFNVADDTIRLDDSVYSVLGAPGVLGVGQFRIGAAAADSNDHIIYNSSTGVLIYDSNGNAGGGAVQFATLAAGLVLTNQDFLIV